MDENKTVTRAARSFLERRQVGREHESIIPVTTDKADDFSIEISSRRRLLTIIIMVAFFAVLGRLFITQIIEGDEWRAQADRQYYQPYQITGQRGKIYTQDGALLVGNHDNYRFFIDNNLLKERNEGRADFNLKNEYQAIAAQITPILSSLYPDEEPSVIQQTFQDKLFNSESRKIINLVARLSPEVKEQLQALNNPVFGFDAFSVRAYPEASLAAQIVGYVGRNEAGFDVGYSGIEGALDKELQGRQSERFLEVDARQNPLSFQADVSSNGTSGRNVYLTIRRDIQNYLEEALNEGLLKYGAKAGEIIVMNPHTGQILGWATLPSYNPEQFNQYERQLLHNPSLADHYEPGSIFKVITVAAGIDTNRITPYTPCPKCSGPRKVADATIKTWNDAYNPGIDMVTALEKSDNTAMVYITDLLGSDLFQDYLHRFKIGEPIGFEIQEDQKTLFPRVWGPVELATRSFGQGITVNSMQMMRAMGAIANGGIMMQPQIVARVEDEASGEEFETSPQIVGQPISTASAQIVTEMLVASARHGEAQWVYKNSDLVAGKTGTAQIADSERGGYLKDQTLASFIGFAPASDPQFVMLVKLTAPSSSPWAAETAAPLWNKVASKLFILLGIKTD